MGEVKALDEKQSVVKNDNVNVNDNKKQIEYGTSNNYSKPDC